MKELSLLIKPASSLCNMRCAYCFYTDAASRRETPSYGLMSADTARRVLATVSSELSPGDRLTIAFQGGEPTLAGIGFFRDFFRTADALLPGVRLDYALQTNGLSLNEDWCALFQERRVLVGISIDGPGEIHNLLRPDAAGKGTYSRVYQSMRLLRRCGVDFNVLTVLSAGMARHPQTVWRWLQEERIGYIQFIPCLAPLDSGAAAPYALTPSRFRDFYLRLFPLWKKSLAEGRLISVKFFDDLINLYLGGRVSACGMTGRCAVQYVVEANGDVFPCDFYALDRYRLGSLLTEPPSALYAAAAPFLAEGRADTERAPCRGCRYAISCGGGCRRQRGSMYVEDGVCRYAQLLDRLLEPLLLFARQYLAGQR